MSSRKERAAEERPGNFSPLSGTISSSFNPRRSLKYDFSVGTLLASALPVYNCVGVTK